MFRKHISCVVLSSFLFQILWPSIAFCMDDPDLSQRRHRLHSTDLRQGEESEFKHLTADSEKEGLNQDYYSVNSNMNTQDSTNARYSSRSLSESNFSSLDTLNLPFIDVAEGPLDRYRSSESYSFNLLDLKDASEWGSFRTQFERQFPLYQELRRIHDEENQVSGLLWKIHNIQFVLMRNGDLCVTGNLAKEFTQSLRITHLDGKLILGDNLNIKRLFVKANTVSHTGKNSTIENLEVWSTDQFVNDQGAHLHSKRITVHEGVSINEGTLLIGSSGILDLKNNNLVNKGKIEAESDDGYTLIGKSLKNNLGAEITGSRKLSFSKTTNKSLIQSKMLDLMVYDLFKNQAEGIIKIENTLSITGDGDVDQQGALEAHTLRINNAGFADHSGWEQQYSYVTIGDKVKRWILGKTSGIDEDQKLSTWTTDVLSLQTSPYASLLNEGVLTIRQKFINNAFSFTNKGTITTNHLEQTNKLDSSVLFNEEEGDITVEGDAIFDSKDVLNHGSFTVKGKTSGFINRLFNHNSLEFTGAVDLTGNYLSNQQYLHTKSGFSWKGQNLSSTLKAKFISDSSLTLEVVNPYTHLGLIQTRDFNYKSFGKVPFDNKGSLIATNSSEIKAQFNNTETGTAQLTGLILDDAVGSAGIPFTNEGQMVLCKLKSLGQTRDYGQILRPIVNGSIRNSKAKLFIEDSGYSYGVEEDKKGRELKYGGFAFGQTTNYGTIGFGSGTYHIRGDFENHGIHEVLKGQDLWYFDLLNYGEIQSNSDYRMDHTRGKVKKIGKVRVKGELLLQFGDKEDAADPICFNDILAEKKVIVEAKTFTHHAEIVPYPRQPGLAAFYLGGNWEFRVNHFTHSGSLEANQLKIISDHFTIGTSNDRMGQIWILKDPSKGWQDNSLVLIKRRGTLSLPHAQLFAEGPITLQSETEGVVFGNAPIGEHRSGYLNIGYNHHYAYSYSHKNNSSIASNDSITVKAAPGHPITLAYTNVEGRKDLILEDPSGIVSNLSSRIWVKGNVYIKGNQFLNHSLPLYHIYVANQPGTGHQWFAEENFNTSDAAELVSEQESILLEVDNLLNEASTLRAAKMITNHGTGIFQSFFTNQGRSRRSYQEHLYMIEHRHHNTWHRNSGYRDSHNEEPAFVQAGQNIVLNYSLQNQNGTMQAGNILLRGDNLSMQGFLDGLMRENADKTNLLKRAEKAYPNLQGLIKAVQDYLANNSSLLHRNPNGALKYTAPIEDQVGKIRNANREYIPIIDKAYKEQQRLPFYAPGDLDAQAFSDIYNAYMGKNFLKVEGKRLIGEDILYKLVLRGLYYQQGGRLHDTRLSEINEAIAFYRPYSVVKDRTPLLVLELYIPKEARRTVLDANPLLEAETIEGKFRQNIHLKNVKLLAYEKDVSLKAHENLFVETADVGAHHDILFSAEENMVLASGVNRVGDGNNYHETLDPTRLNAGNQIIANAGDHLGLKAIQTHSGKGTAFTAQGNIVDETAVLQEHKVTHWGKGNRTEEHRNKHTPSHHNVAEGSFSMLAGGEQVLLAPKVNAPKIIYRAKGSVTFHDVHDTYTRQEETRDTKRTWYGGSKTTTKQSYHSEAISKGAEFISDNPVEVESKQGNVVFINVIAKDMIVKAVQGSVLFKQGENYESSSYVEKQSDLFFQSQTQHAEQHKNYTGNKIYGQVTVISPNDVSIEQVRGETIEWLNRLSVEGGGDINMVMLEELHKVEHHEVKAMTVAPSMVLALAVSMACPTVLASAGPWISAFATGALSAAASQAAVAFVNNNGDIGKAAEQLSNKKTFQNILLSGVTAGLLEGIGAQFNLPTKASDCKNYLDHLNRASLRMSIDMGVSVSTGTPFEEALHQVGRSGLAIMAHRMVASEIGGANLDTVTNKIVHGLAGGVTGVLIQNSRDGFVPAASGAVVGAIVANAIKEDPKVTGERIAKEAIADGKDLRDEKVLDFYVQKEVQSQRLVDWSALGAGVVGILAQQDVVISMQTARTTVENNCAPALGAVIGGVALLRYAVALTAGTMLTQQVTGLITKNQIDIMPDGAEWQDRGFTQDETKAQILETPELDYYIKDQGFDGAPVDLNRGIYEGYQAYDGPDTGIMEMHKNSLGYKGPTHVYEIKKGTEIQKYGESAQGMTKSGQSKRAEQQVRKLKLETGEHHESKIIKHFDNKKDAKQFEHELIKTTKQDDPNALPLNKGLH